MNTPPSFPLTIFYPYTTFEYISLSAFLGDDAKNLSPNVISKLKHHWYNDYEAWQQRDLSKKRYVYWWVDGVYLKARMEGNKSPSAI